VPSAVAKVPLPDAAEIQRLALRHTVWSLGDCIRIAWPRFVDDEWIVVLHPLDSDESIGTLYYDTHGKLDTERSTARETLR
jgi:hypothetical protein